MPGTRNVQAGSVVVSLEVNDLERLDRQKHDRAAFTCKNPKYAEYLKKQARQEQDKDSCACWVLTQKNSKEVIGYYTLSTGSMDLSSLPEDLQKKVARYKEIPVTILGRLAVSNKAEFKGERLGEHVLLDAVERSYKNSREIGSFALVLDSEEDSRGFYEKYGFKEIPGHPYRYYISMKDIEKLIADDC